jgi:hypothetical protein
MAATRRRRRRYEPVGTNPAMLDKVERDKRSQPLTSAQMALIMSAGEIDAGPVGRVLEKVAGTKNIDELSAPQCRKSATLLGLIDKYEHRLKEE